MRLIEIIVKRRDRSLVQTLIDEDLWVDSWVEEMEENMMAVKVLIHDEDEQEILQAIEEGCEDFRVVIHPVEGTLPKPEKTKEEEKEEVTISRFISLSKEELYEDIDGPLKLSANFLLMVLFSSIVAGVGILKNSEPVIIGAMVIAPFITPNLGLSFGTSLGDWPIIRKSLITGFAATALTLAISITWGLLASSTDITPDSKLSYGDVALAMACGFAGSISALSAQGSVMVGVMVAAALLPPLMRGGLLLGQGDWIQSLNSLMIFSTNIICLNLAGIVIFYLAGIRPASWWEQEKAKKKVRVAIALWAIALSVVIAIVLTLHRLNLDSDLGEIKPKEEAQSNNQEEFTP